MNVKSEYKFDDDELDEVYTWVDGFRLSRDKKNIARDFSDGILVGEIIKSVDPSLVELKQLVQTLNTKTKFGNWETLNSSQSMTQE
jgi:CH-like domain in sperm protein